MGSGSSKRAVATADPKRAGLDHLDAGASEASFPICAWRTNDAKNDLTVEAFVEPCNRVVKHAARASIE